MPKKAASKKGAASKKKAPASAGGASDKLTDKAVDNAAPTAHEISLRLELEGLEAELAQAKTDVETARKQNTWLHGELERVAEEMSDYKLFVTKKTSREAEQIEGLNARGQQQLDNISADRARRVAEVWPGVSVSRGCTMQVLHMKRTPERRPDKERESTKTNQCVFWFVL
jgi:hypothetical protein